MEWRSMLGLAWPWSPSPAKDRPPTAPTDTLLTERERDSAKADSYKNGGIHLICDLREKIIDVFVPKPELI